MVTLYVKYWVKRVLIWGDEGKHYKLEKQKVSIEESVLIFNQQSSDFISWKNLTGHPKYALISKLSQNSLFLLLKHILEILKFVITMKI